MNLTCEHTILCIHTVIEISGIEGHFIIKCPLHGILGVYTDTEKIYGSCYMKTKNKTYYFLESYEDFLASAN